MKIIKLLSCILFLQIANVQSQNWNFKPEIIKDNSSLLKGNIDSLYSITMYLKPYKGFCENQGSGRQWQHKIFSGWYLYDRYEVKIPLIGAIGFGDMNERVILYVPENYSDTIAGSDCSIGGYKEIFFARDHNNLTRLKWIKKGSLDTLDVTLTYARERPGPKASIILEINDIGVRDFDINALSGLNAIERIYEIEAKAIENEYFLTFEFQEPSLEGGFGGGSCGAGYETYLGFLHLDENLEVRAFEKRLVASCLYSNLIESYRVQQGSPELGLQKF